MLRYRLQIELNWQRYLKEMIPYIGLRVFVTSEFCSHTLTGSLRIQITQASTRGFLNLYFIMNWPHNEDDYCFCHGINLNFGLSEMFEINAILHLNGHQILQGILAAFGPPNTTTWMALWEHHHIRKARSGLFGFVYGPRRGYRHKQNPDF